MVAHWPLYCWAHSQIKQLSVTLEGHIDTNNKGQQFKLIIPKGFWASRGPEWVATCLMPLAIASEEGRIEGQSSAIILHSSQNPSSHSSKKCGKRMTRAVNTTARKDPYNSLLQSESGHPFAPTPASLPFSQYRKLPSSPSRPLLYLTTHPQVQKQGKKSCAPEAVAVRPVLTMSSL